MFDIEWDYELAEDKPIVLFSIPGMRDEALEMRTRQKGKTKSLSANVAKSVSRSV